jgi:hypothetical protein
MKAQAPIFSELFVREFGGHLPDGLTLEIREDYASGDVIIGFIGDVDRILKDKRWRYVRRP